MTLKAYGKINLGLDALSKRPDGYHELSMIMQTVDIYDELIFKLTDRPGIRLTEEFRFDTEIGGSEPRGAVGAADSPDSEEDQIDLSTIVRADHTNLVWKAANLLLEEFKPEKGVKIHLIKRIPVAAGMAGGSSDCAATLRGLNQLYGWGLSLEELQERGVKLGADVPYCLLGGTALAEGIGEKLTVLPDMPECVLVVAKPSIGIPTPVVFKYLKVYELEYHPDIAGMRKAIEDGNLEGVISRLGNVLETAAIPNFPIVGELKQAMADLGAQGVLMSGSGPTVFGIFSDRLSAETAAKELKEKELAAQVFVTRPCTP
ncbi:MAG: 4-(cytidine 5'-diphospho)-2-C-methyl-D-erythritol kinase [Lachnospiraceae bacterium]|nr:4-(cytidine 5'-diphospho)-2-C-methyl-D-erythritol kinase [Lachnospiraceae bacterium]